MSSRESLTLSYAVRGRVVLKYFGQLCVIFGALSFVTVIVSLIFREYSLTFSYLQVSLVIVLIGILLGRLKAPTNIQPNEALTITSLIFLFTALVSSYPMATAGIRFEDALFESISAVTTTGLSTLPTVEDKARTFLFSRAWMQWIGGLGIVVFSVALLVKPGIATKRLLDMDKKEDFIGSTRDYAVKVSKVYLILTGAGVILLFLLGEDFFSSITHILAAVSTGGFSIYDNSLSGLNNIASQYAVILISLFGSITLILYYQLIQKGKPGKFFSDVEVRVLLAVCMFSTLLLGYLMLLPGNDSLRYVLRHAPVLAFSAQTTTGFSSIDVSELDTASKLVLIISMSLGASVGSTSGGIKIIRLVILIKLLYTMLIRTSLSRHAIVDVRLSGQKLDKDDAERALIVITLFVMVIVLSWFSFVIMGYDPVDSLFEVVSATGTVGLSTGIVNMNLPSFLKGVLCADMLMGRLEVIALLVLVFPQTWFGRRFNGS
jgi:trk system potassium uptake protein TrkH